MMPCLVLAETPKSCNKVDTDNGPTNCIAEDPSWLYYQLEQEANLLLIDCRPFSEYCQAHIEGAINLAISDLMLRRLKKGNMPLGNLINSDAAKEKFTRRGEVERIVLYDSNSRKESLSSNTIKTLSARLAEDNRVCFLEGSYEYFYFISLFWACFVRFFVAKIARNLSGVTRKTRVLRRLE